MTPIQLNDGIIADPSICHGKPTFKGTRIMVWQVLSMLATGDDPKNILKAFPGLTMNQLKNVLEYASSITRNHLITLSPDGWISDPLPVE